jgi:hypothetical protein
MLRLQNAYLAGRHSYSAIWLYDRTANVTFCGQSRPGFARGPAIGAGQPACRRGEAGWVRDVCPSQIGYAPSGMSRSGSAQVNRALLGISGRHCMGGWRASNPHYQLGKLHSTAAQAV